ncbi:hypothetical protein CALCODRAFT_433672, partial [Calocera cornea HHB12733]
PTVQPDETPISPSDAGNNLEKALKGRPEKKDLVDRNILKDTNVAPALHAQQAALERSRLENTLEHKLEARPRPSELVREGILKRACRPCPQSSCMLTAVFSGRSAALLRLTRHL